MFCKFCGNRIDQKTMRCEKCGKEVGPLEGGVGFWDIANREEKNTSHAALPMEDPKTTKESEKRSPVQRKRKNTVRPIVMIAMLAVCVFLGIASLIAINGLEERASVLADSVERLIRKAEMREAGKSVVENHQDIPNAPELDGTTAASELDPKADTTCIIMEPESDILKTKASVQMEFTLKAEGEELKFHWEKRNEETGEWKKIDETQFAVFCEQKEGSYVVKLELGDELKKTGKNELQGSFRCIVTDLNGRQETCAEVHLGGGSVNDFEK